MRGKEPAKKKARGLKTTERDTGGMHHLGKWLTLLI